MPFWHITSSPNNATGTNERDWRNRVSFREGEHTGARVGPGGCFLPETKNAMYDPTAQERGFHTQHLLCDTIGHPCRILLALARFPTYNNRGVAKAIVYVGLIHLCRAGRVAPLPACRRNGEALSFPMHESILSFDEKSKRFSQD